MKCKKLALRVLSTAAVLSIVSSVAAPAFADAYGIATYGMYYVNQGSVTVNGDSVDYYDEAGTLQHVDHDDDIIIKGTTDKNTVTINADKGQTAKVTLDGVKIDVSKTGDGSSGVYGDAAVTVKGDGDTTIKLEGENQLNGGWSRAGVEKSDDECAGKLTITADADDEDHSLVTSGGTGGAGIGSRAENVEAKGPGASNITIAGGKITAIGNNLSAGIGGGRRSTGEVTITGGDVTANGGSFASGIGGSSGNYGKVTITGGKVTASSNGYGTAIGGGNGEGGAADITITGGEVNAVWRNGNTTTGIGGSFECTEKTTITITGGTVNAMGTGNAAGIGAGMGDNQSATIEISGDAKVTAKSAGKTKDNKTGIVSAGTGAAIGTAGNADDVVGEEADLDLSSSTSTVIRESASLPADHVHVWVWDSHTDAGIDQLGETVYKCNSCDATRTDYEPITGHAWDEGEITTEPTCTETGVRTYTCTGCGATKTEVVKALGHTFGEWVSDGAGHKTRTCTRCDASETVADESYNGGTSAQTVSYAPLRVVGADTYEQTVEDGRVVFDVPAQSASLTGSLHALKELKDQGASVLVFRTELCESTVSIDALLAQGAEEEIFTLTHTEGTASLTVSGADQSALLN